MAKAPPPKPRPANLSAEQMRAAVPMLQRRIDELTKFDVATIQKYADPVVQALITKINATLREILGHESIEFEETEAHCVYDVQLADPYHSSSQQIRAAYQSAINLWITRLTTLKELLQERLAYGGMSSLAGSAKTTTSELAAHKVFIVHGHDDGAKDTVARFISKLGLEPVILHEQPNQGRTVIEKFESFAGVAFAVVLFSPDDVGHPAGKPGDAKPRARQNVVLELGFFMAALGRDHVCVLYKGGVEVPSDYSGVLYHPLDNSDNWRLLLAKELKAAGLEVDLNKVI